MREQRVASLIADEFPGEWGDQDAGDGLREAFVLRATNFIDGGLDYSSGARRFIPSIKVARKRLQRGDLILEAAGGGPGVPVGRVARFDPPDDRLYVVSNFFRTLRPATGTDPRFTHHLLDHLYRQPKIWEVQQQTTGIINLKVRDYLQIRVPVPPLEEQRRIAEILDTIDETIQATERVIAKL
ncbi:MAG: restriction endonuclease subunit S [Ilumatobacter sp.]|uniref:restriction endonuclease subunit S n=1 Tax=Ilumatobacter sp. TaxID=1967498 RepID=UPI00391A5CEB